MSDSPTDRLIYDAIDRNTPAVLLAPADGSAGGRRTRLLGDHMGGDGVWVEVPARSYLQLDALRAAGRPVGVAFRSGEHLVHFVSTTVVRCDLRYGVSDAVSVEAALLAWPTDVKVTQRRGGYRVRLPIDAGIKARAWVLPAEPPANQATSASAPAPVLAAPLLQPPAPIPAEVRDLSATGMGVILRPAKGVAPRTKVGDRLRVEMTVDGGTLVVAGRLRHDPRTLPDGSLRTGLDFDGTDRTIEGRRTLARVAQLVAELQRTEARRRKVG